MTEDFSKMGGVKMLKSIDIAEAIMYALSAPQRVNVS
jgi:NADP-dependent 3-hydroxy acid dehydrogenase YdfG